MSRSWKLIPDDREGKILAQYLRGVLNTSGLTVTQVAKAAHMSRSGVSQTIDGRLPKWNTVEHMLHHIHQAAEKAGRTDLIPADLTSHAKALWDECTNHRHTPDHLSGNTNTAAPPHTAADQPTPVAVHASLTDMQVDDCGNTETKPSGRRALWRKLTGPRRPAKQVRR